MCPLPNVLTASDEPLYNIGVVTRMTGISMATLRAWERRYEFPEAKRTSGGHRLYSEQDIVRLHWVKERIEEGMQTAQSIKALRHQEQMGNILLAEQIAVSESTSRFESESSRSEDLYKQYVEKLVAGLSQHRSDTADQTISDALAVFTPEDVILNIITPVIAKFGDLWEVGDITVAEEHYATNYLRHRLLRWMTSGPPSMSMKPIVLACAPDEWHEGGLLVLGALLRRRRFPVAYLGQAVPLEDLANFVRELDPAMLILVAMTENTAANLISWPDWMPGKRQDGKPIIGYSGRVFIEKPEWRQRMKGVYLGSSLFEGVQTVEKLLQG